jgi:hypothetical protein
MSPLSAAALRRGCEADSEKRQFIPVSKYNWAPQDAMRKTTHYLARPNIYANMTRTVRGARRML